MSFTRRERGLCWLVDWSRVSGWHWSVAYGWHVKCGQNFRPTNSNFFKFFGNVADVWNYVTHSFWPIVPYNKWQEQHGEGERVRSCLDRKWSKWSVWKWQPSSHLVVGGFTFFYETDIKSWTVNTLTTAVFLLCTGKNLTKLLT